MECVSQHDNNDLIKDEKSSDPTDLARDVLAEFNRSIPLSSLETSIAFHHNALLLLPPPHSECLLSLAGTLMLQYHHTLQPGDLDEAISLLTKLNSSIEVKDRPTSIFARASAAFLMKFIVTGMEMYQIESLAWHGLLQVCAAESSVFLRLIKLSLDKFKG